MTPQQIFGSNLRGLRKLERISQEELARRAGVHMSEVSRLECGTREPRLGTIAKLAGALGVPVEKLVAGIQPTRRAPS